MDDLSARRAIRPTDDFPIAGLVDEAIPDLELHRQDRARRRRCGVRLLLGLLSSHSDYASSREEDLVRTATRTDEGILLPALGAPDGLVTPPTRTFESVAQIRTASTRADGRGTFLAEPDLRRVETLEVNERPSNIDPKGRPSVHHIPYLESRGAARVAPWTACRRSPHFLSRLIQAPLSPKSTPTAMTAAAKPTRARPSRTRSVIEDLPDH